jgi:microcystin-dependent protein
MPTVTSFTATRSQAIEDGAIVDGTISGDDLILIKHDGSTINAGSVRGPQGNPGPGGTDITGLMELLSPVGSMYEYGGSTAPSGWLLCDGASYLRTDYPDLFAVIGVLFGSADSTHFNVPDFRQRFAIGKAATGTASTLAGTGGSKDAIVGAHSHNHSHVVSITAVGNHVHPIGGDGGNRILITTPISTISFTNAGGGGSQAITYTAVDASGAHSHAAGAAADNTPAGVDPTDGNLPPYVVVTKIIRY